MFQKQGKKLLSAALCVLSLCFSVQWELLPLRPF